VTIKLFILLITLAFSAACTHQTQRNPPSGDITYGPDPYTYQATFSGKGGLKLGEKVRIMTYEFNRSLKEHQGRNFPLSSSKTQIGEATVSNILSNNFYELKTEKPKPLPGNAFIEKF
jgi:hypothetical protein